MRLKSFYKELPVGCNPFSATSSAFFIHPYWPILPSCSAAIKQYERKVKMGMHLATFFFPDLAQQGKTTQIRFKKAGWWFTNLHNPVSHNKNKTQMKRMIQMKLLLRKCNKKDGISDLLFFSSNKKMTFSSFWLEPTLRHFKWYSCSYSLTGLQMFDLMLGALLVSRHLKILSIWNFAGTPK